MPTSESYRPAPLILELGDGFFDPVEAAKFPELTLRFRNQRWAERVGLGALSEEEWEAHFGRFEPLPDNLPQPLALRYHGHQFDSYNPDLGDGRGFLFAQLRDARDRRLLDLGTKGSGRTPYSRGGDGRLTLKGGVREVLATEMLEALGVYTSKTFSLFETGEELMRGDEPSPTRSSVLVRLSHSHVRIGTFQRLGYFDESAKIAQLLDYCVDNFYPELSAESDRPSAFLRAVTRRSAELCASWLVAGFVHGVLNSDNMVVTGESFDYGPYRFLPRYDANFVAAYFDSSGLYAFGRQPRAVLRNLARLGEALTAVAEASALNAALADFPHVLSATRAALLRQRLGLEPLGHDEDLHFSNLCWDFLAASGMPYDQFFFDWYAGSASAQRAASSPSAAHYASPTFAALRAELGRRTASAPHVLSKAYFQGSTPCTLVIDEVERVWSAIAERDDWQPFTQKIADIRELGSIRN
jgi:serine/tyrosine/threonine adenylyltransferase